MSGEPTIGLVMIVKDEAQIIRRCLDSAKPLLDYILIADTGSSDATRDIVRDYLRETGIPGQVVEHAWVNFAWNRSEALKALRQVREIDYGLTIDADETFGFAEDFDPRAFKRSLAADFYDIQVRYGGMVYGRPALFSNRKDFFYKAVLHEYLEAPLGSTRALADDGIFVNVTQDGARSKNKNKFLDDAKLLTDALLTETDPFLISRYTFYLAQSYRDAGEWQLSYDAYLRRAEMGFWEEERYVSLIRAAQLSANLGHPPDMQIATYLRAYDVVPARAEALHGVAAICRATGRYALGYLMAREGILLRPPENGLFVDASVYQYRLLDEYQICAYWTGRYQESLDASRRLLEAAHFGEDERPRLVANRDFAAQRLAEDQAAG